MREACVGAQCNQPLDIVHLECALCPVFRNLRSLLMNDAMMDDLATAARRPIGFDVAS